MTQRFHFWVLSRETENTDLKERMHPYSHCSVTYNSQDMEAAQVLPNLQ